MDAERPKHPQVHCFYRTGKSVGYRLPGAGVFMMMLEGIIPPALKTWFDIVKDAVLDTQDNCEADYLCTLLDDQE